MRGIEGLRSEGLAGHTLTLLAAERRKLLVIGGVTAGGDLPDSLLEYDLERDRWTAAPNGPSVYGHTAGTQFNSIFFTRRYTRKYT